MASLAPEITTLLGLLRAATLKPGNVLPLHLIPAGTQIHNIALDPNGPGILVRSAGAEASVVGHEENGKYTQVSYHKWLIALNLIGCR